MAKKLSIIFMGSAEFAIPSIEKLLENNYDIKAIVTSTDKEAGRGKKITMSAVKEFALQKNLPILQPEKLKDIIFIEKLRKLNADIFVIVAFRMLPKEIWNMPKYGSINLHAALLPDYRGAAPINHVIINGETKTGVTTFFLDENIDTGDIILQKECEILPEDDFGSLYNKLKILGADIVIKSINLIENNNINSVIQKNIENRNLKNANKISKEFCKIDFNKSTKEIHNFIRGLSPIPAAFFVLDNNNIIKIYKSYFEIQNHSFKKGEIISDNKNYMKIATNDGFIFIDEIQMSGKKRMNIKSFLAGNKINFKIIL